MKLVELSVEAFAKQLASDSPAPGGGSVAALAGALGASLCAMVARLTLGRPRYRESWEAMESVGEKADGLGAKLLALVDRDTDAYNRVGAAFKMDKETEAQKSARSKAIQEATREAALVPLETLRTVKELSGLVSDALEKGNPNCVTDAGVAAQLIRTAAAGAAYNVRINLPGLKDKVLVEALCLDTEGLMKDVEAAVVRMEKMVEGKLS
jgi:glutamate formiminotransferase/formiminotetrahydrofolate cyclodeaminase